VRAVLVEPGGKAHGVGEVDAHHVHGRAHGTRQPFQQAQCVRHVEAGEGEAVRILGIEREEGGADQRVEHGFMGPEAWNGGWDDGIRARPPDSMRSRQGASLTGLRRQADVGRQAMLS